MHQRNGLNGRSTKRATSDRRTYSDGRRTLELARASFYLLPRYPSVEKLCFPSFVTASFASIFLRVGP